MPVSPVFWLPPAAPGRACTTCTALAHCVQLSQSLDTIYGAADVFAQSVKAQTGGKFEISVHQAGELMPAFNVVDGVQNGSVEVAHTAPYYFFGKNEVFAIGGAIPVRHELRASDFLDGGWQRRQADD